MVQAGLRLSIVQGRPSVTMVHKGNIMKFTEGAFAAWGYELVKSEFRDQVCGFHMLKACKREEM